jgi:hypothetical protein
MPETSGARIFISYSRKDGAAFALMPPRRRLPIVSATGLRTRFSIPNPTTRASSPTLIIFHSSALSRGRIDAAGQELQSEACEFCGLRNVVDHSEECLSQKASDWPHFSESARYGLSSVQWFERLESREYYRDNQ